MIVRSNISISLKVGIMILASTIVGLFFVSHYSAAASIWPAAGFYIALYTIYRKKSLVGIFTALFITLFVFRLVYVQDSFVVSFVSTIINVISNFISLIVFTYVIDRFTVDVANLSKIKNGLMFTVAAVLGTALGAPVGVFGFAIFHGFENFLSATFSWFIGDFIGVMVFASLLLHAHYRDEKLDNGLINVSSSVIYITIFALISYFIFGQYGNDYITMDNFQISLFVLYTVCAFKFSYRMIVVSNVILLVFIANMHLVYIPEYDLTNEIVLMSIYIMALSSIASLIKNVLYERDSNYTSLEHTRDNLEQIILSTNNLFNIQDKLPDEVEEFNLQYLVDMFELACRIYSKFDKATCTLRSDKYVNFVGAKGYDIEHLNNMKFLSKEFVWSLQSPEIVRNTNYDTVFDEIDKPNEFVQKYGVLKESIRFTVVYGENERAGMSFDLYKGSNESFNEFDLENFRSFQNLMNSYYQVGILNTQKNNLKDGLVLSLVRTLELYDRYTGGHSEEVANLSEEISKRLGLTSEEVRHIYWSAIVHDIGKIGLDSEILNKTTRLTKEEYEEVKKHSLYGFNILDQTEDLKEVALTVRHHHEWWNGTGYPDKLKGIQIPFSSQILHVCDAVSAMAKDRVYKPALSDMEIISELQDGLGKQFSPKVAKFMIKLIEEGELHSYLDSK